MGLLESIRLGTYVPDADPPLATPGHRRTLREAAARVEDGEDLLIVVREFLDQAGRATPDDLATMIDARPALTEDARADALLAGVAEYAAGNAERPCPIWTSEPERFLDHFWFVSREPGFRAIAIAQTPVALKRRGIFWPARSLRRV